MSVKIIASNKSFEGSRAGIRFSKGIGIFDDRELGVKIAEAFGYEIREDDDHEELVEKPKRKASKRVEE